MNKLTLVAALGLAAVSILGIAVCNESRADMIPVPNGDFETLYKPGTTIEGNIPTTPEGGWSQGVGPDCPIDPGSPVAYEFDDGTTGDVADIPGWIGADRDGWIANGGTYDRDETTGNLQGSVASQFNFTDGGIQSYLTNGGDWGNPAGGLIVSDAPLALVERNLTYMVSMMANGAATPITLDLLVDGVALTPSSSVDPVLSNEWQEYSRTYDLASLAGSVGKGLTIQLGVGREASGTQSRFDDVSLSSTVDTGINMLAMTGSQEEANSGSIFQVDPVTANTSFVAQLTLIPDAHRAAWNPMDGLIYHHAGNESWSNSTDSTGYRDHQYLESYDPETGEIVAVFNANPPPADPAPNDLDVFGLEAPTPDWVLPIPRRTVDQTDGQWKDEVGVGRGENEFHGLRDLAWAQAERLWYGSDEHGLFKITPDGESTLVGVPENDPDTSVNESNSLKAMTLVRDLDNGTQTMIVGMRKDLGIYDIDMETAQVSNRRELSLVDENGTVPTDDGESILALAQDPTDGTVYGITRNPVDPFRRKLFTLDVETGVGTLIGELTTPDDDGDFSSLDFSGWIVGDVNGDGDVNGLDVDPFVDVLLNGSDDRLALLTSDINGDNVVNGLDVDPFVAIVVGGGTAAVPEPSTMILAAFAALTLVGFGWRRNR